MIGAEHRTRWRRWWRAGCAARGGQSKGLYHFFIYFIVCRVCRCTQGRQYGRRARSSGPGGSHGVRPDPGRSCGLTCSGGWRWSPALFPCIMLGAPISLLTCCSLPAPCMRRHLARAELPARQTLNQPGPEADPEAAMQQPCSMTGGRHPTWCTLSHVHREPAGGAAAQTSRSSSVRQWGEDRPLPDGADWGRSGREGAGGWMPACMRIGEVVD